MAITLHTDTELPEQTELASQSRERDEFQQQVDKDVASLKFKTATAKWPKPDPKHLYHRYVVSKADLADLKAVIRRACTLHKVEPVFYKDATTEEGHKAVKFHVVRKVNAEGKFVKDEFLNDDGTPKPLK